ncbi:MAG: sugar transferase [Bacteroidales bacterium]
MLFYLFRKLEIRPPCVLCSCRHACSVVSDTGSGWESFFCWPGSCSQFLGFYNDLFRRSHQRFHAHLTSSLAGVLMIFLSCCSATPSPITPITTISFLRSSRFTLLTLVGRMVLTSRTVRRVHRREIGFRTIMIGSNENAVEVYLDIRDQPSSSGHEILGFLNVHKKEHYQLQDHLPHLGSHEAMEDTIRHMGVEEAIIALEPSEHGKIGGILNRLSLMDVRISAIPSMTDILTGKVRTSTIFGTPLLEVKHELMPAWQQNVKQIMDISLSVASLLFLLPLMLFLAVAVKLSSPGPVFYRQSRVGRYGKPFQIFKFRSMYHNAEENGPELSSKHDPRVTRFGQFMRRHRLDEIPNFFNVLRGDMSLVGPRPERAYFIDKITLEAPHYVHLHKVRPGITSWGQVKYGYAENVEEMVKRLRYDILYIENMSLFVDLKILFYTIITILKGRGV